MDPVTVGILGLIILLVLLAIRLPVGYAMATVGLGGFIYMVSSKGGLSMASRAAWDQFASYDFSVVPLFMLMGQFSFASGISSRLYEAAHKWMGHMRGGLAIATVGACAGFAAICGSNTATAATMTAVALPEMRKRDYDHALSTAAIACGSTLGVVIPPSVVLIVYGIYTEQSIGKLFWASTVPGLFLAILLCATVYVMCVVRPEMGPGGPRTTILQKIKAIPGAFEMIFLFALVMVGLFFGLYTPTEAGAAGSLFALVLALIRRSLSWKGFIASIVDTLKVSAMIIVIVAGAIIFGRFLTISVLPHAVTDFASRLPVSPWVIMLVILGVYTVAGCVMDALGFLLVSIPIFFPLVTKMGYDPIWFGVMITLVTTMGAVTPPVGISAYVVSGMSKDIPLATVFSGVIWFLPAYLIAIAVMLLFPQLALILPTYVR